MLDSRYLANAKPTSIISDYIYRIKFIKNQKANPRNGFAPLQKTISHEIFGNDTCVFIADSASFANRMI